MFLPWHTLIRSSAKFTAAATSEWSLSSRRTRRSAHLRACEVILQFQFATPTSFACRVWPRQLAWTARCRRCSTSCQSTKLCRFAQIYCCCCAVKCQSHTHTCAVRLIAVTTGDCILRVESLHQTLRMPPREACCPLHHVANPPACMWQVPLPRLLGHLVYQALLLPCLSGQALQAPLVQHIGPLRLAQVMFLPAQWCCLCFIKTLHVPAAACTTLSQRARASRIDERLIKQNVVCSPGKQLQQQDCI